ncbi:hypothetical protein FACS18942_10500 [Planctomycetales bacterium]|nr:hypothetical protein FACS18942_10500 [Planctomycetales bacterium]
MSDIVLRIDTQSLQTGGKYTLPFFISGLKEKPVLYSVEREGEEIWTRIEYRNIDRHPNGEYGFVQTFKAEEHGNIPFTFVLFEKRGHRCFCWKASTALNIPKDGGNVSIVVDNKIINNVTGDANAVYQPVDNHNVNITLPEQKAATPLSMPFVRKEEFEEHLPIGNRSEPTAARWKLALPNGKETILLTNNPITVGGSRSCGIFFKGNGNEYLYSAVMSRKTPLNIDIGQDEMRFSHQSQRRIKLDSSLLEKGKQSVKTLKDPHTLLFEEFLMLGTIAAKTFTTADWQPEQSDVPPEVLRELLNGGADNELLPPLRLSMPQEHSIDDYVERFVEWHKDKSPQEYEKLADSLAFFRESLENKYAFRDYYFVGSGFQWELPNGFEAAVLPVGKHLYLLFLNNKTVCKDGDSETDINAGQPILLRHGLEIMSGSNTLFTVNNFNPDNIS